MSVPMSRDADEVVGGNVERGRVNGVAQCFDEKARTPNPRKFRCVEVLVLEVGRCGDESAELLILLLIQRFQVRSHRTSLPVSPRYPR
jgi:hypothetical protein